MNLLCLLPRHMHLNPRKCVGGKMRKRHIIAATIAALALGVLPLPAMAGSFNLTPGKWQLTDGVQFSGGGTPSSNRTFCVERGSSRVSDSWFAEFAKPSAGCSSQLISSTATQVQFQMSCPNSSGELKGPAKVSVQASTFTIDSQLAIDLGGVPFPIKRSVTARRIGECY